MSFLDAVQTIMDKKQKNIVADKLIKFLATADDGYAKDQYFHPSGMYYFCPRSYLYQQILPKEIWNVIDPPPDATLRAKFDIGHSLHSWYQNKYFGEMGIIKGVWSCLSCGNHIGEDSAPIFKPKACPNCGKSIFDYKECGLYSPEWNIRGKCDAIINLGDEDYLLDLKTSDPEIFKKMTKPWPSATYQVQIYMWLKGIKKGLLLYIDKSANGPLPIKEFHVPYSNRTVDDVKGKITSYRLAVNTRTIPVCMCPKSGFKANCKEIESVSGVSTLVEEWMGRK